MKKGVRILFAAGGTGGHLKPPEQLADILKKEGCEVLFVAKGLSKNRNFSKRYKYREISSSSLSGGIFRGGGLIFRGFLKSLFLIKKFKADVVVGFGSHYSFPTLLAALVLKKRIVLFESNLSTGRVNRFFTPFSCGLFLQFEKNHKKAIFVNPLPWKSFLNIKRVDAKKKLGLEPEVFTILVFGGSQGSEFVNKTFLKAAFNIDIKFQVIHITGDDEKIKGVYDSLNIRSYVKGFEENMELLYVASDLVVSRSGAMTISEIIFFERPSLLIPFEGSKEDHQKKNARFMADKVGGSLIFFEGEKDFLNSLNLLLKDFKLRKLLISNIKRYKKKVKMEGRDNFVDIIIRHGRGI